MKTLSVSLLLLVACAAVGHAQATQPNTRVDGQPSCTNCRIEMQLMAILGHEQDPVDIFGSTAAGDSKGNVYTTVSGVRQVGVYDSTGRFVGVVGRYGQGPGEFTDIRRISVGPGDTIFVQGSARKVAVFSPQRTLVREFLIPLNFALISVLRDGRLLVRQGFSSPTAAAMPLGLMSSEGVALKGFGSADSIRYDSACQQCQRYVAGEGREAQTVWAATNNRYELTQWTTDGVLRSTLAVDGSPWFQEWSLPSPNPLAEPPRSVIRHVRQDRSGLIWVSGDGASSTWKPYTGPLSGQILGGGEGIGYSPTAINDSEREYLRSKARARASTVEVIDPTTRRVLASMRIENIEVVWELVWLSDNVVFRRDVDADGFVRPKVFRICLQAPQQGTC